MSEIKPCPFCSSKCTSPHSGLVSCSNCDYWGAAIAAHNRAFGAMELVREMASDKSEITVDHYVTATEIMEES